MSQSRLGRFCLVFVSLTAWAATFVSGQVPSGASVNAEVGEVTEVEVTLRERFGLAGFYRKQVKVGRFPVLGSHRVSDAALREAAYLAGSMLAWRPDLLDALAQEGVRFSVMAATEYTTDVPEHALLKPRIYWDRRARGLGATPEAPAVSAAEENLLAFSGDPYPREVIAIHEFAHAVHGMALRRIDPSFDLRLRRAYESAKAMGLWKGTYAMVNHSEYWAEAVQCWFDNNATNDALHTHVSNREELEHYDPKVAALCREVFLDHPWRYRRPADRTPAERKHLEGAPSGIAFRWRAEKVPAVSEVLLQVAEGDVRFVLENIGSSPGAAEFLHQVHEGWFSSGTMTAMEGGFVLRPAKRLPSGQAVADPEREWRFVSRSEAGALGVRFVAGESVLRGIAVRGGAVSVQRVIRWDEHE